MRKCVLIINLYTSTIRRKCHMIAEIPFSRSGWGLGPRLEPDVDVDGRGAPDRGVMHPISMTARSRDDSCHTHYRGGH